MTPPLPVPTLKIPQNDNADLASVIPAENRESFKFERDDWILFRSLDTLPQKAGVSVGNLFRLVLKELADNALDTRAEVRAFIENDVYVIEDNGTGIDGEGADIARLFSIRRPMVSSKLLRLPTRGALGNGLRVAAGAVLSSRGTLAVTTRNQRHVLTPKDDGSTDVVSTPADRPVGTRVEIGFGPYPQSSHLDWAQVAIDFRGGETYAGKSSPHWYTADAFFELLQAAGTLPVRALIERLDGCSGARAGTICANYKATPCAAIDRDQAAALLAVASHEAREVNPARLGAVGEQDHLPPAYAVETAVVNIGSRQPTARVPYVVEAWALPELEKDHFDITVLTNRTPITGSVSAWKEKKEITINGCGLRYLQIDGETGGYTVWVNIISPVIPITSDGKSPDLSPFGYYIGKAIKKAVGKAKRAVPKARKRSQKQIILENLREAIAKVSGDGAYNFNQRNLFYVVREYTKEELGVELEYNYFAGVITNYEAENGDIPGMYRDPRGIIYHPHTGWEIPLGTKSVNDYVRPKWNFNKILYIEKEGFFETLKDIKWPERYDCALMSSKGYGSRAARDLIDSVAEDATEKVTVFCVHDADAYGTMIYQSLQEETRARGRRKVEIVNLGLEAWEAQEMGLASEARDSERDAPVATYVKERRDHWEHWLQRYRYELNAMTMPQFIEWLDGKMIEHGVEKVIPPADVVEEELRNATEFLIRDEITTQLLADAGIDDLVAEAMETAEFPEAEEIEADLPEWLTDHPTDRWVGWVDAGSRTISDTALKKREIEPADSAS